MPLGELRHGGIEQERHVVVENFEHGNLAPVGIIGLATRISALPAVRRCTCSQACSARRAKRGGIVIGEVLNIGVAEQRLGKGPGALARLHVARCIPDRFARALSSRAIMSSICRAVRPQPRSSA